MCDEDADGFIRVEHFVALGLQFGQGDEVSGATPGPARPGPARPAGPDPGSRATFTCRSGYARSGPRLCLARARQDHPDHPPPPPPSVAHFPSSRPGFTPSLREPPTPLLRAAETLSSQGGSDSSRPSGGSQSPPHGGLEPPSLRAIRSPCPFLTEFSPKTAQIPPSLRGVPEPPPSLRGSRTLPLPSGRPRPPGLTWLPVPRSGGTGPSAALLPRAVPAPGALGGRRAFRGGVFIQVTAGLFSVLAELRPYRGPRLRGVLGAEPRAEGAAGGRRPELPGLPAGRGSAAVSEQSGKHQPRWTLKPPGDRLGREDSIQPFSDTA